MEGGIGGVGYGWNNELLEFDPETGKKCKKDKLLINFHNYGHP
jgi:hypothetical protein